MGISFAHIIPAGSVSRTIDLEKFFILIYNMPQQIDLWPSSFEYSTIKL